MLTSTLKAPPRPGNMCGTGVSVSAVGIAELQLNLQLMMRIFALLNDLLNLT